MIIGLIGAQNSHAKHFCEAINKHKTWEDVTVRYIYGADDPEMCRQICEEFGITECPSEETVIEKSDVIAITYRKGSMHFGPAMKALKAGKPIFNDKPFTTDPERAKELIAYAEENGGLITGGTNLKGIEQFAQIREAVRPGSTVVLSFAADPASEYDGYWFYGIHAAELCLVLCGLDYTDVQSFRNNDVVITHVNYTDRKCILVTAPQSHNLAVTVTNGGKTEYYPVALAYQDVSANDLVTMVKTGKPPYDYAHHVKSVELMTKIIESAGL